MSSPREGVVSGTECISRDGTPFLIQLHARKRKRKSTSDKMQHKWTCSTAADRHTKRVSVRMSSELCTERQQSANGIWRKAQVHAHPSGWAHAQLAFVAVPGGGGAKRHMWQTTQKSARCYVCDRDYYVSECPKRLCQKCIGTGHNLKRCPPTAKSKAAVCAIEVGDAEFDNAQNRSNSTPPTSISHTAVSRFSVGRDEFQIVPCSSALLAYIAVLGIH